MPADLSPDNARFVANQIATGHFANGGEALNAAVELLRRQTAVREKVQRGISQLENGQYIELDEEGLDRFFAELFGIAAGQGHGE